MADQRCIDTIHLERTTSGAWVAKFHHAVHHVVVVRIELSPCDVARAIERAWQIAKAYCKAEAAGRDPCPEIREIASVAPTQDAAFCGRFECAFGSPRAPQ